MVDAIGGYNPGNKKRKATPKEIRELRKNMQKVPLIQEKAETYHHDQVALADKALEKELEKKSGATVQADTTEDILETKKERSTLGGQLWRRIVDKFS